MRLFVVRRLLEDLKIGVYSKAGCLFEDRFIRLFEDIRVYSKICVYSKVGVYSK